jgi:hypothetical protein
VNRALSLARILAQELVELDPDEQDDRRNVEVRRHEEQHREAADRRLEIGNGVQPPAEGDCLDEPAGDDEARADARPALGAPLPRPVADEQPEREPDEEDRGESASDPPGDRERTAERAAGCDDEQDCTEERDDDRDTEERRDHEPEPRRTGVLLLVDE